MNFSILQITSAFMVLFAIIDILGSIPIILNIKKKRRRCVCHESFADSIGHSGGFSVLGRVGA